MFLDNLIIYWWFYQLCPIKFLRSHLLVSKIITKLPNFDFLLCSENNLDCKNEYVGNKATVLGMEQFEIM